MLANDERPGECYECIDGRQCPGHGMKCDTSWKNNKCVPKEPRDALRGPCDVRLMIFRRRGLPYLTKMFSFLKGDGGGPNTYKQGDQHILVGITSSQATSDQGDCGNISKMVRLAYVRPWIDEVIGAAEAEYKQIQYCPNGSEADDEF